MCGIFGIIGRNARVPAEVLERATQSLAHRGPDDSGTVILHDSARENVEIGLGNRRLAILDLSPQGHQPMNDPATGNWIVYNAGHDVRLPGSTRPPLDFLMYPQAEAGGELRDSLDPNTFKYVITTKQIV